MAMPDPLWKVYSSVFFVLEFTGIKFYLSASKELAHFV